MNSRPPGTQSVPHEACKLITCVLPNDGIVKELMRALHDEKQVIRVNSTSCKGLAILADARTKFDELPEPTLANKVDIVVPEADADDLYDYIYEKARIARPQGGSMWMGALTLTSPFSLPKDLPLEEP